MNISIEKNNDSTVIKISGRLDTTTAPELENAINGEGEALTHLVLDFNGVNYISSAGLRVLLTAQKKMNVQGSMELINVCEEVMDILEIPNNERIGFKFYIIKLFDININFRILDIMCIKYLFYFFI